MNKSHTKPNSKSLPGKQKVFFGRKKIFIQVQGNFSGFSEKIGLDYFSFPQLYQHLNFSYFWLKKEKKRERRLILNWLILRKKFSVFLRPNFSFCSFRSLFFFNIKKIPAKSYIKFKQIFR